MDIYDTYDKELEEALESLKERYATSSMEIEEFEDLVRYTIFNWQPMAKSRFTSDRINIGRELR